MDKEQKNIHPESDIKKELLKLTVATSLVSSTVATLSIVAQQTEKKILSQQQVITSGLFLSYADALLTYEILERSDALTDDIRISTIDYSKKIIDALKIMRPTLLENGNGNIDDLVVMIEAIIEQIKGENNEN